MLQLDYKVYNLLRTHQMRPVARQVAATTERKPSPKAVPGVGETGSARVARSDRVRSLINFEFVPSGKVHLNREAREHIIDFFK